MSNPKWASISRDYEGERRRLQLRAAKVETHPLLPNRPRESPRKGIKKLPSSGSLGSDPLLDPLSSTGSAFVDPLSQSNDFIDPLSAPITDPLLNIGPASPKNNTKAQRSGIISDPLQSNHGSSSESRSQAIEASRQVAKVLHEDSLTTPWQKKKQQILRDFTVTGNITLNKTAIHEFKGSGVEDGSDTSRVLDKYAQRLASLERRQIKNETVELTQKEYSEHVKKLSRDLDRAWANDERVGSLKLAIQVAKLLADTTVPAFYPSIFVQVTEVLDKFGEMVFQRLRSRAEDAMNNTGTLTGRNGSRSFGGKLNDDFTSNDVPNIAKETCRNWFYKTSCIRELLPRIYVEIALFKCYRFVTETDFGPILYRMASVIRGIGDPLVATYARMYLLVVGSNTVPQVTQHQQGVLQDVIFTLSALRDSHMASELDKRNISPTAYCQLLSPAVEWITNSVGRSAHKEVFQQMLQAYRDHSNEAMVLKHILSSFDASFYAHSAIGVAAIIKVADPVGASLTEVYTALGKQLNLHPPPEDQRLPLLNDVWKIVSKSTNLQQYVECAHAWLDLVQKYYSEREMFVLLSSLSQRLQEHTSTSAASTPALGAAATDVSESVLKDLEYLISSLIGQSSTFGSAVLSSEHLLRILDVFKGNRKVMLCKEILESFKSQATTSDAVLINTLFDLGRVIHDSVDQLSVVTDVSYVADLLCAFIDRIDFKRDLEQQLNFYVECRAAFCNLDRIKDKLIVCVANLSMKAFKIMKGKHSKKTATFVKACLAYCHITIPSLSDLFRRLELLQYCAQAALVNQCLPQTDAFLKAAISLIPDMPTHYEVDGKRLPFEEKLCSFLLSLLSFLMVTPGHPEHGPFYIVHGLLNAVPRYQWQPISGVQVRVFTNMLALLCTFSQKKFPYRIAGVQANDELYGGAPGYLSELSELVSSCLSEILKQLTELGERPEASAKLNQARGALDLINQIVGRMDLNAGVVSFVVKLADLAHKQKAVFARVDQRYFVNTIEYTISTAMRANEPPSTEVITALKNLLK